MELIKYPKREPSVCSKDKNIKDYINTEVAQQYSRSYINEINAINTGIFSILNHKANNMVLSWTGKEKSSFILPLLLLESQTPEAALLVACSD